MTEGAPNGLFPSHVPINLTWKVNGVASVVYLVACNFFYYKPVTFSTTSVTSSRVRQQSLQLHVRKNTSHRTVCVTSGKCSKYGTLLFFRKIPCNWPHPTDSVRVSTSGYRLIVCLWRRLNQYLLSKPRTILKYWLMLVFSPSAVWVNY